MKIFLILFSILFFVNCTVENNNDSSKSTDSQTDKSLNIILLIGDGMGLSQVSTSFYYQDSTNFSRFQNIGLMNTSSVTDKITDSGAGGTALAIGERTYNNAIGVGVDSLIRENIIEILSKYKYKSGIIATCQLPHATPASFFAHVTNRNQYDEIASQIIHSDVDFFAAGGTDYFLRRADGVNYFDSLIYSGFEMDTLSLEKEMLEDKKYGFLLAPDAMPSMINGRGNFLPNATQKAIDYLSKAGNGFFLMVEGSQIDWAGHNNDAKYLIGEMLDFDKTIGVAMDFAAKNNNTLVIVLADHETGGYTLSASHSEGMEGDYNVIQPSFSNSGHSAALIPIFAFGPGSEYFTGIYNNSQIFHKILKSASINIKTN